MVTPAFSLRGYWRTLSVRMAWTPAMTMMRLTTMAMTGRRMKRSVSFIEAPVQSLVGGPGGERGLGRERVVHHHRRVVPELEGACAHHRLAGLEPGDHRDEVPAALAEPDEALPRDGADL